MCRGFSRNFSRYTSGLPNAASARGLDDHRIADLARNFDDFIVLIRQGSFRTRHAGDTRLDHRHFGVDLVTHEPYGLRARTDENETALLDPLGEVGVLRKEAVSRVDGLGIGHL